MYLLSELQIVPLLFLFLLWGIGGWLITLRWFDLEPHERGFIGFGVGLILSNAVGNLLAHILPITIVFWVSAVLVLALGIVSAWPLDWELIRGQFKGFWSRWVWFVATAFLFTLIGRGLGMFDDPQVLPTASVMATGDIPPHLPGAPAVRYGYHYFLILLGVQFMRVASAAPWTALDLARGLTLALAVFLVELLALRFTNNKTVAWLSAAFYMFAGGTRWLLLLLPGAILNKISSTITLIGSAGDTAPNFVEALSRPWVAVGSGPIPFPFAFGNGVNDPSVMAHYGYGVSSGLIMLLLLLLANRQKTWTASIPLIILLASLALANEVDFGLLYLGIVLIAVIWMVQNKRSSPVDKTIRPPRSAWFWIAVTVLAGIMALGQGGLLTEIWRSRLFPNAAADDSYFTVNFSLVPPAIVATHLGRLSFFNLYQLLAVLFEIGPMVLVLPWVLIWGYKALREEKWFHAALAASTIPSLLSIFIEYSGNANITATTRLLSNLLFTCKILGVPLLWLWLQNQSDWKHSITYGLIALCMFSGIVFFGIELIAIPRPVPTYFITDMDAQFYKEYWNRLSPPSAWVLDPDTSRAPTIFGRQTDSLVSWGVTKPEYLSLLENPDPDQLNAAGYSYIYADKEYWKEHGTQLDQPCVRILKTVEGVKQLRSGSAPDFRRLADISGCK